MPDTEGEREQSVLSGLTVLGDTSLELSDTGGDNENGTVSLGGTGNHVLDEVSVTGGVNDSDVVLGSLELPEGNVDGDTTFTLSLELVENPMYTILMSTSTRAFESIKIYLPSVLEGRLSEFGSLLLELLDSSLVNTSTFVDQVTTIISRCSRSDALPH